MGSAEARPVGHIYCGTGAQAGMKDTASLLHGQYCAIWCPPPGKIPFHSDPGPGDKLWLVWRQERGAPAYLLGCGRIAESKPRFGTNILWTNADEQCRGVLQEARRLGFGGPNNMAFLRLDDVRKPVGGFPIVERLDPPHNGLTSATADQGRLLDGLCAKAQREEYSKQATLGGRREAAWALSEGAELGGYRVIRPLGKGGMGEVYLVENVGMGKMYAMKLLPAELAGDESFRERFRREARVMAELDHPGIVRANHMAEEGGRFFLVMDYVEGPGGGPRTLAAELEERGKLPEDDARRIAVELCEALGYAHGRGVVHRDIKPANVLLDRNGRAKLSDFGLARIVGEEFLKGLAERSLSLSLARTRGGARLSQSDNAAVGTYEYMSPEQKAGRPADERSDIYSVGLVVYRMLTGEKAEGRFPLPSHYGCSAGWDTIVEKALATKPEGRWSGAKELLAAAETAGNEASSQRSQRPDKTHTEATTGKGAEEEERQGARKRPGFLQKTREGAGVAFGCCLGVSFFVVFALVLIAVVVARGC